MPEVFTAAQAQLDQAQAAAQQAIGERQANAGTLIAAGFIQIGDLWISPGGMTYNGMGEAYAGMLREQRDIERFEARKADVKGEQARFEREIKALGAKERETAEAISARRRSQEMGVFARELRGATGETTMAQALAPRIEESGARSLQDLLSSITGQEQRTLADLSRIGMGASMDLAGLDLKSQEMADLFYTAAQGTETQRAEIQALYDSQPEWWESILPGIGQAIGSLGLAYAASTIFPPAAPVIAATGSDRRLKKNIVKLSKADNGLNIYSFNYKWNNVPQIGYMADEVKVLYPEAVINIKGYDHVKYAMVG